MTSDSSISPLSPTTISNLRENCSMWSPWSCVRELVVNSVDAGATSVAVRLNLGSHDIKIQVLDDGKGIGGDDMLVVGRQFWTSKVNGRGESLTRIRRLSKLVSISSKTDSGKTWRAEFTKGRRGNVEMEKEGRRSSGTTVTISGFLWNQQLRRKMVKEVADANEIKNGLITFAFMYPTVRFILTQDTEGTRKTVLSTQRADSAAEVFCRLFNSQLGERVKDVRVNDTEKQIFISGFLCIDSHHTRDLQIISVNKQVISFGEMHKEVQDMFRKGKIFQDWKSSLKRFPAFALIMEVPPCDCELISEDSKTLVMFRHKPIVMDMITISVQKFLYENDIVSPPPSPLSSSSSMSPCMSGVKYLPPTQVGTVSSPNKKQSQFIFSPSDPKGRTSFPVYKAMERNNQNRNNIFISPPSDNEDQGYLTEDLTLEQDRSFQDIFDHSDREDEYPPKLTKKFLSEERENYHNQDATTPHPDATTKDPSPLVWSNHNFFYHKSPQPLVMTKCKDAGLKLERSMVKELKLISQVDSKYLATMCGTQLMMWDQHAIHERIRLEEMVMSSMSPGESNHLKMDTLEDFLLVSLPSEDEVLAVTSRHDYCAKWGLALVRTEDTTSIIVMDIPSCLSALQNSMQVELCQAILLELSSIIIAKASLPIIPRAILDHLATQACRGSVMFGQPLTEAKCWQLLFDLAGCNLPFQCAHGRPSVAVLCGTDMAREADEWEEKTDWKKFKRRIDRNIVN